MSPNRHGRNGYQVLLIDSFFGRRCNLNESIFIIIFSGDNIVFLFLRLFKYLTFSSSSLTGILEHVLMLYLPLLLLSLLQAEALVFINEISVKAKPEQQIIVIVFQILHLSLVVKK